MPGLGLQYIVLFLLYSGALVKTTVILVQLKMKSGILNSMGFIWWPLERAYIYFLPEGYKLASSRKEHEILF